MAHKILLVDDEQDVVEHLGKRLAREGFDVVTAQDGEEALLKVQEANPDIILLDLMMPKKNGFETLKEIKDKFKDRWRPVIIVSAQQDLDSTKRCYGMEADHYLTKPCDFDTILGGIRTMISLIPLRTQV